MLSRFYVVKALLAAVVCVGLLGCAPYVAVDLGNRAKTMSAYPRINHVEFVGTSQVSSQVLIFDLDFDDEDGDLDSGELFVSLVGNHENRNGLQLKPIFLRNEIAPNTKEGRFRFAIEISISGEHENSPAAKFEVSLQLKDSLGHTSNVAKLKLMGVFGP